MAKRGMKYKQDYISFWESKGEYGKMRVLRMRIRKRKRYDRAVQRRKDNSKRYGGYWMEDGKAWQYCEWPEGSICEYPCNGDC